MIAAASSRLSRGHGSPFAAFLASSASDPTRRTYSEEIVKVDAVFAGPVGGIAEHQGFDAEFGMPNLADPTRPRLPW